MHLLKNGGALAAKKILMELLNHAGHSQRSFTAIQNAVVGCSEDQLRKFLIEVGARRTSREGEEWWYLKARREAERLAKQSAPVA